MIKIKLATPYFFLGGGGVGVRLSCKRVVSKYSIAYAYCIILHMDATNALIDSQAMVERMVCCILFAHPPFPPFHPPPPKKRRKFA